MRLQTQPRRRPSTDSGVVPRPCVNLMTLQTQPAHVHWEPAARGPSLRPAHHKCTCTSRMHISCLMPTYHIKASRAVLHKQSTMCSLQQASNVLLGASVDPCPYAAGSRDIYTCRQHRIPEHTHWFRLYGGGRGSNAEVLDREMGQNHTCSWMSCRNSFRNSRSCACHMKCGIQHVTRVAVQSPEAVP